MLVRRLHREPIRPDPGMSFFMGRVEAERFPFHWHSHPEIELAWVVRGRGQRYVGDSVEDFAEGDICLLGGELPHSWYSTNAGGVSSRVVQVLPAAIDGVLGAAPELRAVRRLLARANHGLRVAGRTRSVVESVLQRMFTAKRSSWRQLVDLVEILATLAESRDCVPLASAPPDPAERGADAKVDAAFALLHRPPAEIPSQAEAARLLRMSPPSFSRFFRRAMGRTYAEYVGELRLLAACRGLIETDAPVTAVALDAGFANLSNFNRRFRAAKGITPSDFRARCRAAEG